MNTRASPYLEPTLLEAIRARTGPFGISDLAELFSLSPNTVRRMLGTVLPAGSRLGKKYQISQDELLTWATRHVTGPETRLGRANGPVETRLARP